MADFGDDLEGFRTEARTWLAENFSPSLAGRSDLATAEGPVALDADGVLWKQRMGSRGWGVPT